MIVVNLFAILIAVYNLYDMGVFSNGARFPYNQNRAAGWGYLIILLTLNILCMHSLQRGHNAKNENRSLFSLWLKRKKLENEAKIKELEK